MILWPIWISCELVLYCTSFCSVAIYALNFNLFSTIIPRYFIVFTCSKGFFLFKYNLIPFISFLSLLDINITLDFSSLNLILLLADHVVILLSSKFEKFSASLTNGMQMYQLPNVQQINQNKNICDNHSSLDKKCPSLQAILKKCRKNTDY